MAVVFSTSAWSAGGRGVRIVLTVGGRRHSPTVGARPKSGVCRAPDREIARLHTPVGQKNLTQADVEAMINEREAKVAETKAFLEWLLGVEFGDQ